MSAFTCQTPTELLMTNMFFRKKFWQSFWEHVKTDVKKSLKFGDTPYSLWFYEPRTRKRKKRRREKNLKVYNLLLQNWSRDTWEGERDDEWCVYLSQYAEGCVWNTEQCGLTLLSLPQSLKLTQVVEDFPNVPKTGRLQWVNESVSRWSD